MRAAASRTFCTAGRSRPMRMAMIAITTNSSTSVNALRGGRQWVMGRGSGNRPGGRPAGGAELDADDFAVADQADAHPVGGVDPVPDGLDRPVAQDGGEHPGVRPAEPDRPERRLGAVRVPGVRLRDGLPEPDVVLVPPGVVPRLVVPAGAAE